MNAFDDVHIAQESFANLNLRGQDRWIQWTPVTVLTSVGTPVITGRFIRIGRIVFIQVKIVPETSLATTAGTSYIAVPITAGTSGIGGVGAMMNATTNIAVGLCSYDAANGRFYLPTLVASANTFTIAGSYEV